MGESPFNKVDRNIIRNLAEFDSPLKEVKDLMIANDMDEISVEVPLKFKVTLEEINDWSDSDTLENIVHSESWGEAVEYQDIRVEKVEE